MPDSIEFKRECIEPDHGRLSVRRQCELLGLNRSSWYYEAVGESAENLALMRRIDEQYLRKPCYGSRKMAQVMGIDRKRAQRLMRLMGLEAIYPKPRLSQNTTEHPIYPYLLRNVKIVRPNQCWWRPGIEGCLAGGGWRRPAGVEVAAGCGDDYPKLRYWASILLDFGRGGNVSPMPAVDSWLKADVVEILGGLSLSKVGGQKIL